MFKELKKKKRLLIEADLTPVQGDRFQPTGFADLGAATYQLADGTRMLLVESVQSVANHLEATIIETDNELRDDFDGLSYIRAIMTGDSEITTNSLVEAHRINSPFIITDEKFQADFMKDSGYELKKPLNWPKIASAIIKYDVNSLLHGTFLSNLGDGRVKMPRAISGFIEAKNVHEVVSGGVKNNHFDPKGVLRAVNSDKDVYGNVPYHRIEFTAEKITAYFNIDISLLESYTGKNTDLFDLLVSLALYKTVSFLDDGTRLRTACDLKLVNGLTVTEPSGFEIPTKEELKKTLKDKIKACKKFFADPSVTVITTETVVKKTKKSEGSDATTGND